MMMSLGHQFQRQLPSKFGNSLGYEAKRDFISTMLNQSSVHIRVALCVYVCMWHMYVCMYACT